MGILSCPPLKDTPGPVAINFAPDFFFLLARFHVVSGCAWANGVTSGVIDSGELNEPGHLREQTPYQCHDLALPLSRPL